MSLMLKEFREFIAKGSVLDLAVGIVIGAAFTAIVSSFVKDILTPIIGIFGKANFENLFFVLKAGAGAGDSGNYTTLDAAQKAGAVTLNYGVFVNAVINFLIVAFAIFLVVKAANKLKRKQEEEPAAAPEPSAEVKLLTEIRDSLKK
jgi:large conductance mechanosensitive channel